MLDSQINWDDLFQKMADIYPGTLECVDTLSHKYKSIYRLGTIDFQLTQGPMDLIGIILDNTTFYVTYSPWAILMLACGRL
jgi:hypothetical protein